MIFQNEVLLRIAISILGFCGFFVARRIRAHKTKGKPLVCPMRFDCHAVIHSDYSRFFGMPIELLGMSYYGFIAISYLFSSIYVYMFSHALSHSLIVFMIILSVIAFLFSCYLIFVQLFILKKGCSWCFTSAFISVSIFILTVITYHLSSLAGIFSLGSL